jgi:hypothetical protein
LPQETLRRAIAAHHDRRHEDGAKKSWLWHGGCEVRNADAVRIGAIMPTTTHFEFWVSYVPNRRHPKIDHSNRWNRKALAKEPLPDRS